MAGRGASPFDCKSCGARDKSERNCLNRLGLSEAARTVESYTEEIKEELRDKGAKKVFSLGAMRLYECPLSYVTSESWEIVRLLFAVDDSRALLHGGGLGNQPYWLIESLEIYRAECIKNIKGKSDV